MPKVSVVIPLFNKGPHIARAIESVLCQSEQRFEIIVVDGQSTDEGVEVVKSITDPRVALHDQKGRGVSSARNEGVLQSCSNMIAFLDADDEWMPDHLETLLRLRNRYPGAGAYTTAYCIKKNGSKIEPAEFYKIIEGDLEGLMPNYFKSAAFGSPPIWTSAACVPKSILLEMGGFATDAWWGEDIDLWGKIALKYPIAFSHYGRSIYHTDALNRACKRVEPVRENIFVSYAKDAITKGMVPPWAEEYITEYIALKTIETAWRNISANRPDLARINLKDCKTKYFRISRYWAMLWACIPSEMFFQLEQHASNPEIIYNILHIPKQYKT